MRRAGGHILLTYNELVPKVVTSNNLKQLHFRKQISYYTRGGNGREAEVIYESLPSRYQAKVCEVYPPNPQRWIELAESFDTKDALAQRKEKLKEAIEVLTWEYEGILESLSVRHKKQAMDIALGCAYCRFYLKLRGKADAELFGYAGLGEVLEALLALSEEEGIKSLASNGVRRFQQKVQQYKQIGYKALINKKFGNKNSEKLQTEEQKSVLRQLFAKANKFDYVEVQAQYNKIARQLGWHCLSESVVRTYLSKAEVKAQVSIKREGLSVWRNEYDLIIHRQRATKPNYLWVSDATPLELMYQKSRRHKKGHYETTFHNRKTVSMVIDAYSYAILGYYVGDTEDANSNFEAFKMAVLRTGVKPWQIKTDNGGGHKANWEFYSKISEYITPSAVGNARDKVIEQMFDKFNQQVLRHFDNYSFSNHGARLDKNKPNTEHSNAIKKAFPTEEEVVKQIDLAIAYWNNGIGKDGKSRWQKYEGGNHAEDRKLLEADKIDLFGQYLTKTIRYTNAGLVLYREGEKLVYNKVERDFIIQNIGKSFRVKVDLDNPKMVVIEDEEGNKHILTEFVKSKVAYKDMSEGDRAILNDYLRVKNEVRTHLQVANETDMELIESNVLLKQQFVINGRQKEMLTAAKVASGRRLAELPTGNKVVEEDLLESDVFANHNLGSGKSIFDDKEACGRQLE